ncbi:hypothetical protein E4U22_004546 [Claviceps purpurea]|nr:hypothetical protein E4U48_004687 [Claviceps purpurea]KAG6289813.1 hypothetical protein E4U45_007524 [Claviceps purpurea]KAG6319418.1 hypothetical protein E4U22_004546 [Claviceps purpurea]
MSTSGTGEEKKENISYASFMSSKPFEFLVGPEKKVYTIHSGLAARLSPVLDRLVNGDMEEAKKGFVEWKHVDEQTFIRFRQYAYMKTYEYPSFRPEPPADSRSGALRHDTKTQHRNTAQSEAVNDSKTPQLGKKLWEYFEDQLSISEPYMAMQQASPLGEGQSNEAELLLSHARLYVFADCYGITPLMRLSLCTLHHVLMKVLESNDLTDMVVELLEYCYENDTPHALRDLVVEYVVCQVEYLWLDPAFQDIARAHGDFSAAVVNGLRRRIT